MGGREELEKARAEIERLNFAATEPEWMDRLDFVQTGDGYHVFYFGSEALHILTGALTKPSVSEALLSLSLSAPDRGQGFIGNLAQMSPIPALRFFAWGEYCQTYMENWRERTTGFEDMLALFRAAAFDSVRV